MFLRNIFYIVRKLKYKECFIEKCIVSVINLIFLSIKKCYVLHSRLDIHN